MSEEKAIKDFTFYTSEMEKGMKDKLFFLDFLDEHQSYNFLDYGCANGKVLEAISNVRKNQYDVFCGYDKSSEMIQLAKSQWQGFNINAEFISHWPDRHVDKNKPTVLILSSVLHEIYSFYSQVFGSKAWIKEFWKEVFEANADYIVIRDMCWSSDMDREMEGERNILRSCNGLQGYEIKSYFLPNFLRYSDVTEKQVEEFEAVWGPITNIKNFLHLLLKYRYVVNWEREVKENYFALSDKELFSRVFNSQYNIQYVSRFQLPIIEKFTKLGFGNDINDNTHIKMILKRSSK